MDVRAKGGAERQRTRPDRKRLVAKEVFALTFEILGKERGSYVSCACACGGRAAGG
jgi:hypothetical protein